MEERVTDSRRALARACRHWYPVIWDLHKSFKAIARAVCNDDGKKKKKRKKKRNKEKKKKKKKERERETMTLDPMVCDKMNSNNAHASV